MATIDLFTVERFINGIPSYRGKLCGSGYNFVRINPDGTIIRCGSKKRLGNLLRKKVKLWNAPKPCNTSYCPYFCDKYTSSQRLPEKRSTYRGLAAVSKTSGEESARPTKL